ncbi:MAG: DUF11 domain-containing protein, partial [Caldilineaceae bacterium]|nr:DUF11 domain-containing protein [Caldilineaceae bacterium]
QYFSGGSAGTNTCTIPGCGANTVTVPRFDTVVVTVSDGGTGTISGVPVYVFSGTSYTSRNATSDTNGQATFNLPEGSYNFRADVNGVQYFSGGSAGTNSCTVLGCTADTVTASVFENVTVTVTDSNGPVADGTPVYVFSGASYTSRTANTVGGQVTFSLPSGSYNFRADIASTTGGANYQYFSGGAAGIDTCVVVGCGANGDTITVPLFATVTVAVTDGNSPVADGTPVYVFRGTSYTGRNAATVGGQVAFMLPADSYNFRADIAPTSGGAAYRYFSGGASGTDSCVIVGCTADSINVPVFGDVAVTVNDAGNILANQAVYVFDINQQYLNRQGQTGGAGEPVSFNLPAGSYLFASDFAGSRYFSAQCDVTACTAALIASSIDADLSIAKSVDRAFAAINDGVVFTLVAGNAGPMGATGVAVTDQLPAGLTYSSDDGNGAYDANTGVWTIGSLAANATATLNITAIVDAAAEGQSLTNSAQISGAVNDNNAQNDTATATVAVGVSTLCARPGSMTMPNGEQVTIWGYAPGACALNNPAQVPGPTIVANQGDTVSLTVENGLAEITSVLFAGQAMRPDLVGIAPGVARTFNFTVGEAGTYLYEASAFVGGAHQVPMGLYGALIVDSGVTGQAYGNAFDQEAVLLLSEIDPNLNANPGNFNLLNYHPTYWLINGAAYPDVPAIVANPGERVLLRYLNAGFDHPSMTLLGGYQRVIAKEGFKLNHSFDAVAETIPAGATADMIVNTAGLQGNLALYNRNMYVTNGDAYPGGMLTFLNLSAPTGMPPMADMVAPVNDAIITGNMVLVQIDASDVEDDANLGAGNLSVNWDVDGGTPQMAVYNGVSGYYEATLDTTALNDGAHIINASVTDSDNNIVYVSNNVNVDNGAPVDNPPTVNAGVDQSIILPDAATLDGTVTDDGLSTLITAWSMTSGPGIVTFGDASLVDTTASFSVDGVYVLRLTATDDT